MRRRLSVGLALSVLCGTLAVSVISALTLLKTTQAAAPPFLPATPYQISVAPVKTSYFVDSQSAMAKRGIRLSTDPSYSTNLASWTPANPDDKDTVSLAALITSEWNKYSDESVQASGIRAIYLVRNLSVSGQKRAGMPEPAHEQALYFDVSPVYQASESGIYMRRVLHHEFNHLITYNLSGSYAPADIAWISCNSAGFHYGNGGAQMYDDPVFAHMWHPVDGFLDGYATSGIEEDKAEMFAEYMTNPPHLQSVANSDAGIMCKLHLLQSFVQTRLRM